MNDHIFRHRDGRTTLAAFRTGALGTLPFVALIEETNEVGHYLVYTLQSRQAWVSESGMLRTRECSVHDTVLLTGILARHGWLPLDTRGRSQPSPPPAATPTEDIIL